jgi:acyl-coenzyme A thioesterase PaaI-like protein
MSEEEVEEFNTMNELQGSARSSQYGRRNGARLLAVGDGVARARMSDQAVRRGLLHEGAIVTAAFLICVLAISIIINRMFPSDSPVAPMTDWPPGSL